MEFNELGLLEPTVQSLQGLGFESPTEIQHKAIPEIFSGRDIMASAETGSGKTAAYALPIIQNQKKQRIRSRKPRTLVLVPTRELAIQVKAQFDRFSFDSGLRSVCIYGGTGMERQTRILKRGVDVIVATPGRLFDHIKQGNADLSETAILILDEADRMLDMGFMPQVKQIVAKMQKRSQTLMFSATISQAIENAASIFLKNPVTIRVNSNRIEPKNINQQIFQIDESEKEEMLLSIINDHPDVNSVLVFARTRIRATKIRKKLRASNVAAEEIHGNISQNKREKTLKRYRRGEFSVLVATDVAARGLDIPEISHVVNYDLPDCAADYVHRIGRTGRAGRSGVALSFVCPKQRHLIRGIEKVTGRKLVADSDRKDSDNQQNDTPRRNSRNRNRNRNRNRSQSRNRSRARGRVKERV